MIAELDISSEKAEDTLNHQEEIQTFNNNLFNPNSKPQSTPNQSLPLEDPSPLIQETQRMPNQESGEVYQGGEYDDPQKDTLDLNYQAEIQAQQDNQGGSSSQTGRLEDLLKDADMALRRSQHLAAVLSEDSSNHVKYQNQYGENFPGQSQQINSIGSSNEKPKIIENLQKYTHTTNNTNTDFFQENQNNNNKDNFGSETNTFWNDVSQGQPQSIESWKSNPTPESRFLDKSYGAKLKAAYDLFPIQEAIESGAETPRESNRNSLNNFVFNQFRPENPSDKLKAYNFTQTTSLVDQVLKNSSEMKGHGGVTPAFRQTEQINVAVKPTWETVTKSAVKTEDPYLQVAEPKRDEGHLSNRSYKTETPDPFLDAKQTTSKYELDLTKEGMDKKIDEILKKHFGGNNETDALSNTNLRSSQISNKQQNWKYNLPEQNANIEFYRPSLSLGGSFKDDYNLPRDSASIDTFGNPFYVANAPRQTGITQTVKTVESAYLNSPGNPLLTLASPTSSTQNKPSYKFPDNVFSNSSERGTTDLRFSQDQFLKAESEHIKRNANYADIKSFSSPQGTYKNQYDNQNEKSGFKFTSPLLQKYSNPFVEDYFHKNGAPKRASPGDRKSKHEERISPPKERELQSRPFNSGLRDFDHKVVESKEQSPEKGNQENNPYFLNSQNIYSPPASNRTAENDFAKPNAQVIQSDTKSKSSGVPVLSYPAYRAQDLEEDQRIEDFDDPFENEEFGAGGVPKTQFESLKQYQPNPSENIEEDFEKMNMMFDHVNAFYGHPEVQSPLEEDKMEFPESTPGKYTDFLNSDRRFEAGHEMVPGHETTPDKKLKKLTFKNRLSEERHHNEKKGPEENGQDKISERDLGPESKQRKKIFDDKAFGHEKQLQEEVLNSERVLREMEKDSEKNKRIIFSEMPKRKDIDILMEPLQEEIKNSPIEENKPTQDQSSKIQITPREQKNVSVSNGDLEGRKDSERFPFQLKNGVMDPTESFFDFENENFLTNEDYVRQQMLQKNIDKPIIQGGLKLNSGIAQPLSKPQETTRRKSNVLGKIWILDVSNVQEESVDLANPQSISQNLKKVPVLTHCFEKFRHITDNFPHA